MALGLSEITEEELAKRRVPALIAYLSPLCIVEKDDASEPWSATIEQVNGRSWDYIALHEVMGGVDVGLVSPYHMVIARDGALALPSLPELRSDQAAVEYFNRCLAALLLGGIYTRKRGTWEQIVRIYRSARFAPASPDSQPWRLFRS